MRGESTIVVRHGGFADKVRCHAAWAIPLPSGLDPRRAGPLFCGGITVFHPILDLGVRPTDRVVNTRGRLHAVGAVLEPCRCRLSG